MNLLEEYENGIRGLKLQANVAMVSLTHNLQTEKKQLAEAHGLIASSPNILKSKLIKQFMKEKNIPSFVDVDIDILKQWVAENFQFDHSRLISISASKEFDEIVHFTDGYQKLKDDELTVDYLELASYSLCGEHINFFGGHHIAVALENNHSSVEEFVKESGFDIEKICPKCLEMINYNLSKKSHE